jgi:curved DNA-binding protein CbpA
MSKIDPYKVLEVPKDASFEQVKRAYRKKAKSAHPDVGGSSESFGMLVKAFKVLSDEDARAYFDRTGEIKEDEPDNSQAMVFEFVLSVFDRIIAEVAAEGKIDLILQYPLVEKALQKVMEFEGQTKKQNNSLEKMISIYESFLGRFVCEKEDNMLERIFKGKIRNLKSQKEKNDITLRMTQSASEFLKNYQFVKDASVVHFTVPFGNVHVNIY